MRFPWNSNVTFVGMFVLSKSSSSNYVVSTWFCEPVSLWADWGLFFRHTNRVPRGNKNYRVQLSARSFIFSSCELLALSCQALPVPQAHMFLITVARAGSWESILKLWHSLFSNENQVKGSGRFFKILFFLMSSELIGECSILHVLKFMHDKEARNIFWTGLYVWR